MCSGSFVPHGRQDVLTAAIGRPEHPGRVRAAGAGVTIKQYFGSAPRTSRSSSSMPPEDLQQLTQKIRDQLEESIIEKGLALPPEPKVGPSGARVSTKESCVAPSGNDPETSDSDKYRLYIEENPSRLVALGRLYEGSTAVHNITLLHGQVKVGVEEVKDAEAFVPIPTDEATVSPQKPPESPDHEVDDPLYLMTLTILQLFLKPLQVMWDATMFGVFNQNFPLYIKHEDLSEIAHGGQCLSISVIQLWILHLTETSLRARNSDVYGFLEPQSIQRFGQSLDNYLKEIINIILMKLDHWKQETQGTSHPVGICIHNAKNKREDCEHYIETWVKESQREVYLGPYLNHAMKTLSTTLEGKTDQAVPQWIEPKSHIQTRGYECGYYVMHWMWCIWFFDGTPLNKEAMTTLRNKWAGYFLQIKNMDLSNLQVWFHRPKDITRKLLSGDLDLGIVGLDSFTEHGQIPQYGIFENVNSVDELAKMPQKSLYELLSVSPILMTTPPTSPPHSDIPSDATSRRTRQSTWLRRLIVRSLDQPWPTVNVNPATGRGSTPHKEKFHSYLGVVAREKIPIVHSNWNVVPETLKNLIWDDILGKFDIPEGDNAKKKGQAKDDPSIKYGIDATTWAEFAKSHQTPNWQGIRKKSQEIQKYNDCLHLLSHGGYELLEKKLMDEKRKTREHQAEFTENSSMSVDPPSPISRHESLEEQTTQGIFVPHKHLKEFHIVCSTMKPPDVQEDQQIMIVKK
ncbi:ATP phosphoribosyltransferase 1, chloroplastic [Glycine soja]